MAMRKNERLMNLLIMLLVAQRHLDKEHIRQALYGGSGDEAFEKMFERDKEDLRSLGVPIDMASLDLFFDDLQGYRIRRDEFQLPDIALEADEAAVLGLAARVWQHAGLAGATSDAVLKLKAAGIEVDRGVLDFVEPQLTADEPSFDAFWSAVQERRPVAFDYQRSGSSEVTTRHLQPWRVAWSSGRWYVLGLDTDRGDVRLFRLSRVRSDVRVTGRARSYELPTDVDFDLLTRQLTPATEPPQAATLLVRTGAANGLRRQATSMSVGVAGPDGRTGWDRITVDSRSLEVLADEVVGFAGDAYVEAPEELRKRVVERLRAAAGAG